MPWRRDVGPHARVEGDRPWGHISRSFSHGYMWALERMRPSLGGTPFDLVVDDYVRGTALSEKLLEAVSNRADRLLAWYLIGLTHLAGGDRPAAIKEFEAVEREGNFAFASKFGYAYSTSCWAHLFLHRLREDPKWPPWIPVKPAPTTQPVGRDVPTRRE